MKRAKNAFCKICFKFNNMNIKNMLDKWKTSSHLIAKETAKQVNAQLVNANDISKQEIKASEIAKSTLEDSLVQWKTKEKEQGIVALIKNFTLWQERRVGDAFKLWLNRTKHDKKVVQLLTRYFIKRGNNNMRAAMTKWRTENFLLHLQSIKEDMMRRVGKYDTFTRFSAMKLDETDGELKQLKEIYNELKKQHDVDEKKIEKISQILDRLKRVYIGYSFHSNFFLGWVDMFRREKALQAKLKAISSSYVGKHIFAKLKEKSEENKAKLQLVKCWSRALGSIAHANLKQALHNWQLAAKESREQTHLTEIQSKQILYENKQASLEKLHERAGIIYEKEIVKQRKLKVFRAWETQVALQRLFRRKSTQLNDAIRIRRLDCSFKGWRADKQKIDKQREQVERANSHYTHNLLRSSLLGWKMVHKAEVLLPKVLDKLSKRQYLKALGDAYDCLMNNKATVEQASGEMKQKGAIQLSCALDRLYSTQMASSMSTLIERSQKIKLNKALLRRILLHALQRKLSDSLGVWRKKVEEQKVVEIVETKGKTAEMVSEVIRKHFALKKLVEFEGLYKNKQRSIAPAHEEKHVDDFEELNFSAHPPKRVAEGEIMENKEELNILPQNEMAEPDTEVVECSGKKSQNTNIINKFLHLWSLRQEGQERIGKYIRYWKKWLGIRKSIQKNASFVLKRLNNGAKSWAFDKLRNLKRAGNRTFQNLPRTEIIKKYILVK